jgi:hypothetical protein
VSPKTEVSWTGRGKGMGLLGDEKVQWLSTVGCPVTQPLSGSWILKLSIGHLGERGKGEKGGEEG